MTQEPTYEEVDESGDGNFATTKTMNSEARLGKSKLQLDALSATGRKYFASAPQHKAFRKFEALTIGGTDKARLWKAWLENRVEVAIKYHTKIDDIITSFGNEVKRDAWWGDNRKEILARPLVGNVRSTMNERMEKLKEKANAKRPDNTPSESY